MEKVIRNGMVAILYSPGYGAGWYSWNTKYKELLFHPKLVEMVENGRRDELTDEWIKDNLGIDIYASGARKLEIEWIPEGSNFTIDEYDGSESVNTLLEFITA